MKLSILIPALTDREESRRKLLAVLSEQPHKDEREIVTLLDDGEETIGRKRNQLLDQAQGEYVVFIDDDDLVSENYLELIFEALESGPDVVPISGLFYDPRESEPAVWSCGIGVMWGRRKEINWQGLTHLCPVKRSIALKARFPEDGNNGEDREYGFKLDELCHTEVRIIEPIYFYYYDPYKKV